MPSLWPFVIAEAATTHHGVRGRAMTLVDVASASGAQAVKFSYWSDPAQVARRMHCPEHEAMYRDLGLPAQWLPGLADAAHRAGMEFLCTVDCPEDIAVVAPHVDRFKIASWGATDWAFIEAHRAYGKPLVISTGLCVEAEWERTPFLAESPTRGDTWLLHCVSAYPAPLEELNLASIRVGRLDGFSDHTAKFSTGAWAVCAGAKVLEVHYRAWDTPEDNPDFAVSLTPGGLLTYIQLARQAYQALGDGMKRCMPSEAPNRRFRYVDR